MTIPVRHYTLDAMRGLAAIAVVVLHAQHILLPGGTIAVDFFFALSGFVIARTYDSRFVRGLSASRFVGLRVVRLYPLYLAGLCFGVARIATSSFQAVGTYSSWDIVVTVLFGLAFLPSPFMTELGPLNAPSWSLYMELLANVFYAFALARCRTIVLIAVMAVSGFGIAYGALVHGSADLGVVWSTAWGGVARVIFGFTLGMIVSRIHNRIINGGWMCLAPIAILFGAMFAPGLRGDRAVVDLVMIFTAVPAALWLGATLNLPARLARPAAALGQISYPLYAIHFPVLLWLNAGPLALHRVRFSFWFTTYLVAVMALAWVLARSWDPVIRMHLKRILRNFAYRWILKSSSVR
ncbi:MAG: acyltransferase 3 family protein [Rhodoferax sp.]|nr:acyltransferase 3 family protein [Rhodoferax sp.]